VSPTFEAPPSVWRAYRRLARRQRAAFERARLLLVEGLRQTPPTYHPSLRIKRHTASGEGVWELSFGDGGRALFRRGEERRRGEPHIEWLAIGEHKLVE